MSTAAVPHRDPDGRWELDPPPVLPSAGPTWAVFGVHGGAGAATVTGLLTGDLSTSAGADTGPAAVRLGPGDALPAGAAPVLVARTTARGLTATANVLAEWHPAVPRPWLVLVADAPAPMPPAARYRARALQGQVRGLARLPWLWPLRGADSLTDVTAARTVTRAARQLRTDLTDLPPAPAPAAALATTAPNPARSSGPQHEKG